MKGQVASIFIVVALLIGAGIGYFGDSALNHNPTTVTSTSLNYTTTTRTLSTATVTDSCYTLSSLANVAIPVGLEPTVSYEGGWSVSMATFSAKSTNASALAYTCNYEGNGTVTFYVPLANYLGGWNTLVVLAHKFGSNGTLTVHASGGNQTVTNSTTQSQGSVTLTLTFYFDN